jgi:hypothetical protein
MDGKQDMKVGDLVCYEDHAYHVGACMTSTSIELVELNAPSQGLWVGRDEVHQAPIEIRAANRKTAPPKTSAF